MSNVKFMLWKEVDGKRYKINLAEALWNLGITTPRTTERPIKHQSHCPKCGVSHSNPQPCNYCHE
jgi:hypothetical protein